MRGIWRSSAPAALAIWAMACGHKPPYSLGDGPESSALLQRAEPQLDAVAVSDASITINRIARADLLMLAQVDARFRASVTKAGNELVTLAFSEDGYGLRYKLDEIPTGFYEGPADPCAVEALLGIPLPYEGLVALVLGGAPLVDGAQIIKQKWDRKRGYEVLTLSGGGFVQELRFAWFENAWVFAGGQMWEGSAEARGRWLWTLEHDRHRSVAGALLPGRTRIRAPGKRRDNLIVINYKDHTTDLPWMKTGVDSEPGVTSDGGSDSDDDGGWENSDDDGGWENSDDDGGWENSPETNGNDKGDSAEERSHQNPSRDEAADPDEVSANSERSFAMGYSSRRTKAPSGAFAPLVLTLSPGAPTSNIPPVFRLDAAGLTRRGDLCR